MCAYPPLSHPNFPQCEAIGIFAENRAGGDRFPSPPSWHRLADVSQNSLGVSHVAGPSFSKSEEKWFRRLATSLNQRIYLPWIVHFFPPRVSKDQEPMPALRAAVPGALKLAAYRGRPGILPRGHAKGI